MFVSYLFYVLIMYFETIDCYHTSSRIEDTRSIKKPFTMSTDRVFFRKLAKKHVTVSRHRKSVWNDVTKSLYTVSRKLKVPYFLRVKNAKKTPHHSWSKQALAPEFNNSYKTYQHNTPRIPFFSPLREYFRNLSVKNYDEDNNKFTIIYKKHENIDPTTPKPITYKATTEHLESKSTESNAYPRSETLAERKDKITDIERKPTFMEVVTAEKLTPGSAESNRPETHTMMKKKTEPVDEVTKTINNSFRTVIQNPTNKTDVFSNDSHYLTVKKNDSEVTKGFVELLLDITPAFSKVNDREFKRRIFDSDESALGRNLDVIDKNDEIKTYSTDIVDQEREEYVVEKDVYSTHITKFVDLKNVQIDTNKKIIKIPLVTRSTGTNALAKEEEGETIMFPHVTRSKGNNAIVKEDRNTGHDFSNKVLFHIDDTYKKEGSENIDNNLNDAEMYRKFLATIRQQGLSTLDHNDDIILRNFMEPVPYHYNVHYKKLNTTRPVTFGTSINVPFIDYGKDDNPVLYTFSTDTLSWVNIGKYPKSLWKPSYIFFTPGTIPLWQPTTEAMVATTESHHTFITREIYTNEIISKLEVIKKSKEIEQTTRKVINYVTNFNPIQTMHTKYQKLAAQRRNMLNVDAIVEKLNKPSTKLLNLRRQWANREFARGSTGHSDIYLNMFDNFYDKDFTKRVNILEPKEFPQDNYRRSLLRERLGQDVNVPGSYGMRHVDVAYTGFFQDYLMERLQRYKTWSMLVPYNSAKFTRNTKPFYGTTKILALFSLATYKAAPWVLSTEAQILRNDYIVLTEPQPALRYTRFRNAEKPQKCYECGLATEKLPTKAYCSGMFTQSKKTKVTKVTCSPISAKPRKVQLHGCFKRYLDVGTLYDERGCRTWPPRKGTSYASERFAALEKTLGGANDRCVVSPHASITPFARGISLFARYYVCVCSQKYCNRAYFIDISLETIFVCSLLSFLRNIFYF